MGYIEPKNLKVLNTLLVNKQVGLAYFFSKTRVDRNIFIIILYTASILLAFRCITYRNNSLFLNN